MQNIIMGCTSGKLAAGDFRQKKIAELQGKIESLEIFSSFFCKINIPAILEKEYMESCKFVKKYRQNSRNIMMQICVEHRYKHKIYLNIGTYKQEYEIPYEIQQLRIEDTYKKFCNTATDNLLNQIRNMKSYTMTPYPYSENYFVVTQC